MESKGYGCMKNAAFPLPSLQVDMKVKSTPTFFLYRNGELLHSFSGIKNDVLKKAILERLKSTETGRDWCALFIIF
jgi:hypothetical protein